MPPNTFARTLNTIAQWSATLTLALLPLFFIPLPWATVPHAKFLLLAIGVSIGLLAFAVSRFAVGTFSLPKSYILYTSILIPIAYAISVVVHGSAGTSFFGFGVERDTLLASFLWFGALLLGVFGFESRERVTKSYKIILILSAVVVVFQLLRLVIGPDILTFGGVLTGTAASVVGSWHDLGIFLGLTIVLAAAFLGSTHSAGFLRWVAVGSIILAFVGLIVINVVDVWAVLTAIGVVLALYHAWSYKKTQESVTWVQAGMHKSTLLWCAIALVSILFAFFGTLAHDHLPSRLRVVQTEVRPSWQGTFDVATAVYKSSGALFGSGPNTFVRQWGLYKPAGVNETAFWNADFAQGVGFIPTTFITLGLLGVFVWGVFFLAFLWEAFTFLKRSFRDASVEPIAAGLFGGALYLWALLFLYPPGPAIIALAFLTTGLALSWATHSGLVPVATWSTHTTRFQSYGVYTVFLLLGLVVCVAGAMLSRAVISDMYVNKSIYAFNAGQGAATAEGYLATALTIQSTNDRAHRAGVELGILQIASLAQSTSTDAEKLRSDLQAAITDAINHGLSAVSTNPGDYENWITLARVYEQLVGAQVPGAYERAEESYKNAIVANPSNPVPHFLLARLALTKNDSVSALAYLKDAIAKKPNFAEAHFLLSQIESAQGNKEGAQASAISAVQSAPQEPVAWFQLGALYYADAQYENAAAALERAVLLNNNYANALYVLALTYSELGRVDLATRVLEQVALLNPDNANVKELISALQKKAAETSTSTPSVTPTTSVE